MKNLIFFSALLSTASAAMTVITWIVDENAISPICSVINSVLLAAMFWLNYDTNREYWKMVDIAERAIDIAEESSREFERKSGEGLSNGIQ